MYSACFLKSIRNDLPLEFTLSQLAEQAPYSKFIEGFLRFECPHCHQHRATVNPKNNLAHCFCCQKNINNIDLMVEIGYDFKQAVVILEKWMRQYKTGSILKKNIIFPYISKDLIDNITSQCTHILLQFFQNLGNITFFGLNSIHF